MLTTVTVNQISHEQKILLTVHGDLQGVYKQGQEHIRTGD